MDNARYDFPKTRDPLYLIAIMNPIVVTTSGLKNEKIDAIVSASSADAP